MATKRKYVTDTTSKESKSTQPEQDIDKGEASEKLSERDRQRAEFRWCENIKSLSKGFESIDLGSLTINNLYKSIDNVLQSFGSVKNEKIVGDDSIVKLIKGQETSEISLGELVDFCRDKANDPNYATVGLGFDKMVVADFKENPFMHPLAKSLGITNMDEEWLEKHAFLTFDAYKSLTAGEHIEKGLFNTTADEAIKNIDSYQKVKKLVYHNNKAYVTSIYQLELQDVVLDQS